MDQNESVGPRDFLSVLTEADRQRRSTRLFTASGGGAAAGVVGRVTNYQLGHDSQHAFVFRVDATGREFVVTFAEIVRVEMI